MSQSFEAKSPTKKQESENNERPAEITERKAFNCC